MNKKGPEGPFFIIELPSIEKLMDTKPH